MDLPTGLLRDLLQLSSSAGFDDAAVQAPLTALVAGLRAAVPSYRGLHLTVVETDHPVSLTVFHSPQDEQSIMASLRVPFGALGQGFDPESRVVFYAATPGAFVDLAADLGYALQTPTTTAGNPPNPGHDGHQGPDGRCDGDRPAIILDADLPPASLVLNLIGLEGLSTINRAVGILIDQGHHPDQAHATLCGHADTAGIAPHLYAARLLQRRTDPATA